MATSTGGFVARAERSSVLDVPSATGSVGPGEYNIAGAREGLVIPAAVPFHTSKEKVLCENTTTSAVTPGVGSYDAGQAIDALKWKHIAPSGPTANFASHAPRLQPNKSTSAASPGPGTYTGGNKWIKKDHHYKAPQTQQRLSFSRVPSAPSIPTVQQSYGYEEGVMGTLIMQKPPDPIHTGCGQDTVGPGSYSPSLIPPARKAVAWGKDKRGFKYATEVPGPGAYNPAKPSMRSHNNPVVVVVNGMEVQFGGAHGTSQFASKVPLFSQRTPSDHIKTPGPGAYVEGAGLASKAVPLPPDLQFFGSGAKRQCEIDPMKSLSAPSFFRNPGPGAYDDPRKAFKLIRSLADPLPFASTGQRFGKDDNGIPGPGEYKPEAAVNMTKAQMDKATISRGGVFGTAAERFPDHAERSIQFLPAPNTYSPKLEPASPAHKGDQAVFESRTDRFRAVTAPPTSPERKRADGVGQMGDSLARGDPANLGPGSYAVPDPWTTVKRHPSSKAPAFGSESTRSQVARQTTTETPGPGRYKQAVNMKEVYRPYVSPVKDSAFGTSGQRIKHYTSFTPGPGHYNGAANSGLAKKTYNVTYNEFAA